VDFVVDPSLQCGRVDRCFGIGVFCGCPFVRGLVKDESLEIARNLRDRIEYARFADDLVILIDAYKRHDWLVGAADKRLREEFGKLQVEINDEKSRTVDLERGECFGIRGFEFRYLRGLSGAMRPH
jgi:RNA-directed DNA polymerase